MISIPGTKHSQVNQAVLVDFFDSQKRTQLRPLSRRPSQSELFAARSVHAPPPAWLRQPGGRSQKLCHISIYQSCPNLEAPATTDSLLKGKRLERRLSSVCKTFPTKLGWCALHDSNVRPPGSSPGETRQLGAAGDRCPQVFLTDLTARDYPGPPEASAVCLPFVSRAERNGCRFSAALRPTYRCCPSSTMTAFVARGTSSL
jgi:hypothetical protein